MREQLEINLLYFKGLKTMASIKLTDKIIRSLLVYLTEDSVSANWFF